VSRFGTPHRHAVLIISIFIKSFSAVRGGRGGPPKRVVVLLELCTRMRRFFRAKSGKIASLAKSGSMQAKATTDKLAPDSSGAGFRLRAQKIYGWVLDLIVAVLITIMLMALIGAMVGLLLDFIGSVNAFRSGVASHRLAHGFVDALDRELVIDVLSVFVLIELFRTFTDYLELHRVRIRVLAEVGIAFILREIFIGLYDHSIGSAEILALATLLAVLIAARIAAVRFPPHADSTE